MNRRRLFGGFGAIAVSGSIAGAALAKSTVPSSVSRLDALEQTVNDLHLANLAGLCSMSSQICTLNMLISSLQTQVSVQQSLQIEHEAAVLAGDFPRRS